MQYTSVCYDHMSLTPNAIIATVQTTEEDLHILDGDSNTGNEMSKGKFKTAPLC